MSRSFWTGPRRGPGLLFGPALGLVATLCLLSTDASACENPEIDEGIVPFDDGPTVGPSFLFSAPPGGIWVAPSTNGVLELVPIELADDPDAELLDLEVETFSAATSIYRVPQGLGPGTWVVPDASRQHDALGGLRFDVIEPLELAAPELSLTSAFVEEREIPDAPCPSDVPPEQAGREPTATIHSRWDVEADLGPRGERRPSHLYIDVWELGPDEMPDIRAERTVELTTLDWLTRASETPQRFTVVGEDLSARRVVVVVTDALTGEKTQAEIEVDAAPPPRAEGGCSHLRFGSDGGPPWATLMFVVAGWLSRRRVHRAAATESAGET